MARTVAIVLSVLALVAGVVVARELASEWGRGGGEKERTEKEGSVRPPALSPPTPPTPPPPSGTADCIALAQQVGRGSCSSFLNDVKNDIGGMASQSDDGFKASLAPYVSRHGSNGRLDGNCCNEAASFVAEGCSCNRLILSAATRLGFSGTVVSSIPRLYQFSCAGGSSSFANGCSFSGYGASGR